MSDLHENAMIGLMHLIKISDIYPSEDVHKHIEYVNERDKSFIVRFPQGHNFISAWNAQGSAFSSNIVFSQDLEWANFEVNVIKQEAEPTDDMNKGGRLTPMLMRMA